MTHFGTGFLATSNLIYESRKRLLTEVGLPIVRQEKMRNKPPPLTQQSVLPQSALIDSFRDILCGPDWVAERSGFEPSVQLREPKGRRVRRLHESTLVRELIVAQWCLSARTSPVSVESKGKRVAILRQKLPIRSAYTHLVS
jgi:hypothetical protein